ncbi:MAG: prepilin-type N-terminal cleavage/methylation domain-containing protein [Candidatus Omnitrophica bacterium]|nr:prepilin-type N-terminal cleavage/methylation domain-containing protein [Candidatus Omnitrophota bacterium]
MGKDRFCSSNHKSNNKGIIIPTGFTLLELIVVVVIIGILVGLALPNYEKSMERARIAEAVTILKSIHGAQMRYAIENDAYTSTNLDISIPTIGKYFTFTVLFGSPTPPPDDDQTLALAQRIGTNNYFRGQYLITITEKGNISSNFIPVQSMLSNN